MQNGAREASENHQRLREVERQTEMTFNDIQTRFATIESQIQETNASVAALTNSVAHLSIELDNHMATSAAQLQAASEQTQHFRVVEKLLHALMAQSGTSTDPSSIEAICADHRPAPTPTQSESQGNTFSPY